MEPPERLESLAAHELDAAAAVARRLAENVARAVEVDDDVLRCVIVVLAAEGHVLIEDYPGVGKTALARSLARPIDGQLARTEGGDRVLALEPVVTPTEIVALQEAAARVHAAPTLRDYVVELLGRTRTDPRVELGGSPRAGLMLLRAAKALAALDGRDHALPDDVQAMAQPVLAHRLAVPPEEAGEELEATRRPLVADAVSATPAI